MNKDARRIRGCSHPDMRRTILAAMSAGVRYRMTKSGVLFYGEDGETASVHLTSSDHRAYRNLLTNLRRIGFNPPRK